MYFLAACAVLHTSTSTMCTELQVCGQASTATWLTNAEYRLDCPRVPLELIGRMSELENMRHFCFCYVP